MTDNLNMKEITLYTDGACSGNPGPGGYAAILLYDKHRKEISGGYKNTTNNRMELRAVIAGLEALKEKCNVTILSDSKYIVDAMNQGWARRWQANNWKRNKKEKALNVDLWKCILDLCNQHDVTFKWVESHAGNKYNERCDELAVSESLKTDLPDDVRDEEFDLM